MGTEGMEVCNMFPEPISCLCFSSYYNVIIYYFAPQVVGHGYRYVTSLHKSQLPFRSSVLYHLRQAFATLLSVRYV
jgi:hypothetical protein